MHHLITFAAALGLLAATVPAAAQPAGTWSIEFGITRLSPQVRSGDLSAPALPSTQVDVSGATGMSGAVSYMLDDHFAVSIPIGTGRPYSITGAGRANGLGKLAEVSILPITVLGQYRFGAARAAVRPYLGGGLSYVRFYGETGSVALTALTNPAGTATTLSVRNQLAPVMQVGVLWSVNSRWFVNLHYARSLLSERAHFSTGQTLDLALDPDTYSLALGYRF